MRYSIIPALLLTSPVLAHPTALPHAHGADWTAPVAALVAAGIVAVLLRRVARARK